MPPSADDAAAATSNGEASKRPTSDDVADTEAGAAKKAKVGNDAIADSTTAAEERLAETRAFGKLILFGEHFVVYKVPAYVGAVAAYTDCAMELEETTEGDAASPELEIVDNRPAVPDYKVKKFDEAKEAINLVFKHLPMEKPCKIKLTFGGDLCCASGIGASAAQVVSLARAIKQTVPKYSNMTEDEINAAGYEGEKGYHGTPSGIDNTAATFGGLLKFQRTDGEPIFEKKKIKDPIKIVYASTGLTSSTTEVVGDVRAKKEKDPEWFDGLMKEYCALAEKGEVAMEEGDLTTLGKLMDENHVLLQKLTVSCKELDDLVVAARAAGAIGAKMSGTGRGGLMLALTPTDEVQDAVAEALEKAGAPQHRDFAPQFEVQQEETEGINIEMPPHNNSSQESVPLVRPLNGGGSTNGGDGSTSLTARGAFENSNAEASRQYHDSRLSASHSGSSQEDWHQSEGGLLKPVIFGGLDGILTSFAIVAGSAGGGLSPTVVLVLGFSNIFADALSMGVGEFLSSKATNEWILSEKKREEWELENYREGEIQEMVDIYVSKGMSYDDAKVVIETMAKYDDFFVDIMMQQELELQVPEENHVQESLKEGFVMFCSFAFFGAMPLLGYVIIPISFPHLDPSVLFKAACIVTGMVLFLLGSIKSNFSRSNWMYSGLETLLLGGACATMAYTIGKYVNDLVGEDEDVGMH
ncbi:mevalonate kinase [Nitzschia inconspicua]|uniref:Mevalonate kinase n=1 Tax=Nitzschia inconspicua TaxID=303405 RepID=A0A9K3LL31_9STRA|nr:mevalonate kinase [Nitzschia inconspicua]